MSKGLAEVEALADRLTIDEKLQLVKHLERETMKVRLDRLFAEADRERKGRRFTMAGIVREIKAYRRERRQDVNHSRRH